MKFSGNLAEFLQDSFSLSMPRAACFPSSHEPSLTEHTVLISGTFTVDPIILPLRHWLNWLGMNWRVETAPYGQAFQQLLDPSSMMGVNRSGVNVLLIRAADWLSDATNRMPNEVLAQFLSAIDNFQDRSRTPLIVVVCESAPTQSADKTQLSVVESLLSSELAKRPGVQVVHYEELDSLYPVARKFDPVTLRAAHIPFSQEYSTALASLLCRKIVSSTRPPYKVVAVDCDQTLWDGVCAEDGSRGVRITEDRRRLQNRLKELSNAGMLVCLCSKNQPDDVWAVFDDNPEMILRREDVVAHRINWLPKSENLRSLAGELNLGLDSFIFIDDNPIECAEVRAQCAEVLTLELPQQDISNFLKHVWAFDIPVTSEEDRLRAQRYADERKRQQLRQSVMTLDEFLANIGLTVDIAAMQDTEIDRVSQMSQRTNQMNFTTIRRSPAELRHLCSEARHSCAVVRVSDKFGDYGLVGAMIYLIDSGCLRLDTFLLSCRALGRRVERQMLRHLLELAKKDACQKIVLPYQRTAKNQPAFDLLESLGTSWKADPVSLTSMELTVSDFESALRRSQDGGFANTCQESEHSQITLAASATDSHSISRSSSDSDTAMLVAGELTSVDQILQHIANHAIKRPEMDEPFAPAQNPLQQKVAEICCRVMNLDRIGINDSLKVLGLTSLNVVQILGGLHRELNANLSIAELFSLPTVRDISQRLAQSGSKHGDAPSRTSVRCASDRGNKSFDTCNSIAIVGLSGRFPGAENVAELWNNLVQGKCSIVDIPEDQLNLPSDSPLRKNPNLVKRAASIEKPEYFDAKFFGIFPKEAQVMDPQHRILLECCWHALEDAGYQPDNVPVPVGLFAGCYMDTYILASLASNPQLLESLANSFHGGDLQTELGNDKDYLVTRVSYHLNLRGPAMTVQTACSTSLVAIAQACQSLILRQCDMALAGGVTLKLPQNRGYLYAEGGMVSPDGVCRTFDAKARGTVFGEGAGMVVLKRLNDALADGDDIYAVLKGWGLNNDGRAKLGYTAPSTDGQYHAIRLAHQMAGISAETIGYMEAHGTGTALGDPIEVEALTRAFRKTTDEKQFCAIGSLKTNIGHLDVAAGVSGLIKVCLSMRNELIPPSLQFETPNPNIDFENSPFFVNTQLRPWKRSEKVRRAGLSSFGVGGTNAHVVIEEPPDVSMFPSSRTELLFPLSARSPSALKKLRHQLADYLESNPAACLGDMAYTLQTGRKKFNYSQLLMAQSSDALIRQLRQQDEDAKSSRHQVRRDVPSVWMFPGQGSQYMNMGRELYEREPVFTEALNECFTILEPLLGFDLREKLFGDTNPRDDSANSVTLRNTEFAQPAIFCVSYAYARWLMACGVQPHVMVGHSVGEFVAACLGGVFSLTDALRVVVFRARLMQQLPEGTMLAVRTDEHTARRILQEMSLTEDISIAAVNSPVLCVVSGMVESISRFQTALETQGIATIPLHTSHAFHSAMMDPVIEPFAQVLSEIQLSPSQLPVISSVTGQPLTAEQACDPMYWARHLRETVRFSAAIGAAAKSQRCVLIEVGPGQTLSTLARQQPGLEEGQVVLAVSPHAKQQTSPVRQLWSALGSLWQEGVAVDFSGAYRCEQRRRLHLPGYPFERQRYWFDQIPIDAEDSNSQVVVANNDSPKTPKAGETEINVQENGNATAPLQSSMIEHNDNSNELSMAACGSTAGSELGALQDQDFIETIIQHQLAILQQQLECWQKP